MNQNKSFLKFRIRSSLQWRSWGFRLLCHSFGFTFSKIN